MVWRKFLGVGRASVPAERNEGKGAGLVPEDPGAIIAQLPVFLHRPLPDGDLLGEGEIVVGELDHSFAARGRFHDKGSSEISVAPAGIDLPNGGRCAVKKQRKHAFDLIIHVIILPKY